jgi:DNA polymerase III subunit alpha
MHSLDGAATPEDIILRNKELGATHVAITDHGTLGGLMEHYESCQKHGMKPILGCEFYLENPMVKDLEPVLLAEAEAEISIDAKNRLDKVEERFQKKIKNEYVHLTCHFKTESAYLHFCRLTPLMESRALVKWGERKPIIKLEELHAVRKDITICSSCLIGSVQKLLLPRRGSGFTSPELAEKAYHLLREIVGPDSFYVEVFPHNITKTWVAPKRDSETKRIVEPGFFKPHECTPENPTGDIQLGPNQFVMNLARKNKDKMIISLDSHFARPEQEIVQRAKLGNGTENWRFSNSYHVMSTDEAAITMQPSLSLSDRDIEEMVDNSYHWASHFDHFKMTTMKDRFVMDLPPANWSQVLQDMIARHGRMDWTNRTMVDRLKLEINVLAHNPKLNLMPYFFTVEDVANFCRENGILMNVRGSASGSLLLYLIGVSAVNPIQYELSFARFLTVGRINSGSLPDADLDISERDRVISYLESKYGDNFARISTEQKLKLKSAIKDAERALEGTVSKTTEDLTRVLPAPPQGVDDHEYVFGSTSKDGDHVEGIFDTSKLLQEYAKRKPLVWSAVTEMLGVQRQRGVHPCASVIADKPVQDYVPVTYIGGTRVTAFGPKSVEKAGLIKYDFLGLNTLRDIQSCLKSIKDRTGKDIIWNNLPYDEKVFIEFAKGNTATVFQFDTATVRPYLRNIKPKSILDLASITALARPGTLDAPYGDGRTLAEVYVARAQGEPIEYLHPDLEPVLRDTMGIFVFQEQQLDVFKKIAGFSDEQAEEARRGIGKKDKDLVIKETDKLRIPLAEKGWSQDQIGLLIEQLLAASRYSFNKSHAVSYAMTAYSCQWLKLNYPLDWWKSILSNASKDEIATKFWKNVKEFVMLPDINNSKQDFSIVGDKLYSPLSILTGVGEKAYRQLVSNAPYANLEAFVKIHFAKRTDGTRSAVNSGMVKKMIAAGIMDSMFPGVEYTDVKIGQFLALKSTIRKEKLEAVDEEYLTSNPLDDYMARKKLMDIYSEDLRKIILPRRFGKSDSLGYNNGNNYYIKASAVDQDGHDITCASGEMIEMARLMAEEQRCPEMSFVAVGYVIDESSIQYQQKTKTATKMTLDVNGVFYEDVLWPAWGDTESPSGFQSLPVLLFYKSTFNRLSLKKIIPLITKTKVD